MITRKRRLYLHKGKVRFKRRLPRKLKKNREIEFEIQFEKYKSHLINLHGDNWFEYIIFGG